MKILSILGCLLFCWSSMADSNILVETEYHVEYEMCLKGKPVTEKELLPHAIEVLGTPNVSLSKRPPRYGADMSFTSSQGKTKASFAYFTVIDTCS